MDDGTSAELEEEQMGSAISGGVGRVATWFDHVINGLTLAGILALVGATWRLSDTVTRIDTLLAAKVQQNDRDFARIDATLDRHDQRITDLERGEGTRQRNAQH